ncbi:response regulator [Solimicrobium silvestre]|uniref:Response regulator receiver domain n=1 Tax=Solimicrobium silvestre TaxID=2099400 RepID=A0A2S9H045_9BURK|nr:response regulator [Solimicrobium silvestre]PRC93359.1 Response regulator receiver domain [Solimicrobium silvestre]
MKRIMLVDDEENVLHSLQRALRKIGNEQQLLFELHTSPIDAIKRLGEAQFNLVISDYHMPAMSGVDFLKLAKAIQPETIRLMLSASADFKTLLDAINEAEVFRYIEKPWNVSDLEEVVRLALLQYGNALAERLLLNESKLQKNEITPQEFEAKKLEMEEPGITKVKWGTDGSVLLE